MGLGSQHWVLFLALGWGEWGLVVRAVGAESQDSCLLGSGGGVGPSG